jgi:hypothetical protein
MTLDRLAIPSVLEGWQDVPELLSSVEHINICESSCSKQSLSLEEMNLHIHVYQPSDGDSFEEFSTGFGNRDDDDDTMAASICELPNRGWDGLWNSLIYAGDIKLKLLDYIHATLLLSDANVDCEYNSQISSPPLPGLKFRQSILFHGIGLSSSMALPEQGRRPSVALLHKSCLFDYHTGTCYQSSVAY